MSPRPKLQGGLAGSTRTRTRAGITLTEILISIMIMGVGLLSLATLFPLGLIRIREANRSSRSALLTQSAGGELAARGLLYKPAFTMSWYGVQDFVPTTGARPQARSIAFDPFVYDPTNPLDPTVLGGVNRGLGTGLPIAYDPLWWQIVGRANGGQVRPTTVPARFGYGQGFVRDDPNGGAPSAYGLQRLTNFLTTMGSDEPVASVFASADDLVLLTDGSIQAADPAMPWTTETGSPIMPQLTPSGVTGSAGSPLVDLSYSWLFTGQQTDVTNGRVFSGDIVVCQNRPFALDTVTDPIKGSTLQLAAGETVVEAAFAFGPPPLGATVGYSNNTNTVLLRWPANMPDPDVRIGAWIADITYEQLQMVNDARFGGASSYPGQRCYWYRIANRTDAGPSLSFSGDSGPYRQMTITLAGSVRARTLMSNSGVLQPATVNAALIMPSVVNVFPRTITIQ